MLLRNKDAIDAEIACDLNVFIFRDFSDRYVVFITISDSYDNDLFVYIYTNDSNA